MEATIIRENFDTWLEAMKDELKAVVNEIWDLDELPKGPKTVVVNGYLRHKGTPKGRSNDSKLYLWPRVLLRENVSIIMKPTCQYQGVHSKLSWRL